MSVLVGGFAGARAAAENWRLIFKRKRHVFIIYNTLRNVLFFLYLFLRGSRAKNQIKIY